MVPSLNTINMQPDLSLFSSGYGIGGRGVEIIRVRKKKGVGQDKMNLQFCFFFQMHLNFGVRGGMRTIRGWRDGQMDL